MTGTLLNVGTVLVGSSVGLVLGERLPERITTRASQIGKPAGLGYGEAFRKLERSELDI